MGFPSRFDVKNRLTEECENRTIRESPSLTMITKLEHTDITASSRSSRRHSGFSFGIPSVLKSIARTSAISSTRSGRTAAARQCSNRRACPWLCFPISLSIRSYVLSRRSGNSSRTRRMLDGRACCRTSNWQDTQLSLFHVLRLAYKQKITPLHSIRIFQ